MRQSCATPKCVAFGEALKPEFKTYQQQIVKNAARSLGYRVVKDADDVKRLKRELASGGIGRFVTAQS